MTVPGTTSAWHDRVMGVLYDYFSAASDEQAATTIDAPGGPDGAGARLPMPATEILKRHGHEGLRELLKPRLRRAETGFLVVATKGFDPTADLGTIEETLTGVRYDDLLARPRTSHALAERDGGERLVLTLSDELQAALANATSTDLSTAAGQWAEHNGHRDAQPAADLLAELSALARVATAHGERLYCWVSL